MDLEKIPLYDENEMMTDSFAALLADSIVEEAGNTSMAVAICDINGKLLHFVRGGLDPLPQDFSDFAIEKANAALELQKDTILLEPPLKSIGHAPGGVLIPCADWIGWHGDEKAPITTFAGAIGVSSNENGAWNHNTAKNGLLQFVRDWKKAFPE